jgi:hypothetical protein
VVAAVGLAELDAADDEEAEDEDVDFSEDFSDEEALVVDFSGEEVDDDSVEDLSGEERESVR